MEVDTLAVRTAWHSWAVQGVHRSTTISGSQLSCVIPCTVQLNLTWMTKTTSCAILFLMNGGTLAASAAPAPRSHASSVCRTCPRMQGIAWYTILHDLLLMTERSV